MEEAGNFVVCCYSHMKCFHVIGLLTDKVDVKLFFICKGMLFLKLFPLASWKIRNENNGMIFYTL